MVSGDAEGVETPEDAYAAGEASGVRWSILGVLRARWLWLTPEVRDRVAHCARLKTLEHWLARAANAPMAEDIFEPDAFASGTTLEEMLEERLIERQMWEAYAGQLEGYADAVCTVLKARGLEVGEEARERIRRCRLRPQFVVDSEGGDSGERGGGVRAGWMSRRSVLLRTGSVGRFFSRSRPAGRDCTFWGPAVSGLVRTGRSGSKSIPWPGSGSRRHSSFGRTTWISRKGRFGCALGRGSNRGRRCYRTSTRCRSSSAGSTSA